MPLSAFTNEPGSHDRYEPVNEYQYGKYFDDNNVYEHINSYNCKKEFCQKLTPLHSDHHRCTDWFRFISKVTSDRPALLRRFATIGEGEETRTLIDLTIEHHISSEHSLGSYIPPDPAYDETKARSVAIALNRLNSDSSNWGENLGQGKKTVEEFASRVIKIGKALHSLKRGDVGQAAKDFAGLSGKTSLKSAQKSAADLWLEYSYGWKPLADDLCNLQKNVHELMQKPIPIRSTGHAQSHHDVDFIDNGTVHKGTNYSDVRTCFNARVTNPSLHLLNTAGLANPASIAWELVPWSFVIDWFVPVGSTLQALTAGVGLTSDGGWSTTKATATLHMSKVLTFKKGEVNYGYAQAGDYAEEHFAFQRQCYADFPLPGIYSNPNPYSSTRALNALALVRQLV